MLFQAPQLLFDNAESITLGKNIDAAIAKKRLAALKNASVDLSLNKLHRDARKVVISDSSDNQYLIASCDLAFAGYDLQPLVRVGPGLNGALDPGLKLRPAFTADLKDVFTMLDFFGDNGLMNRLDDKADRLYKATDGFTTGSPLITAISILFGCGDLSPSEHHAMVVSPAAVELRRPAAASAHCPRSFSPSHSLLQTPKLSKGKITDLLTIKTSLPGLSHSALDDGRVH